MVLYDFENQDFFSGTNQEIYGYHDYLAERFNRQISYQSMVEKIASLVETTSDEKPSFLDIGCGLGYLMDCAHDGGFRVAGIEFNSIAADRLREKYSFPVFVGDMLNYEGPKHDVVTMMDVIEHVTDPIRAVRQIHARLSDRGLLVLTTMDCDSLVSRLLGSRLEDFRRVREHLYFFTRPSITRVLEEEGFEVESIAFHGHTFRLDFLANRLALVSPIMGRMVRWGIRALHLGSLQIHLNPGTKMIVYARKTSTVSAVSERSRGVAVEEVSIA